MVRLWLVNEENGNAYPVCDPFDGGEIVAESQTTVNTPKMDAVFDVARVNIPVKVTAMLRDQGNPAPAHLHQR